MEAFQQIRTAPGHESEDHAWLEFDQMMSFASDYFRVHKEVSGELIQPRALTGEAGVRIDRLIVPTQLGCQVGWKHGPFGVEVKRSDKKVGPVISQAMDYSRSVFRLPQGFMVMLEWVFIWPLDGAGGDLGSVMAQHRIGYVRKQGTRLIFGCGGTNGIVVSRDAVTAKSLPMGRKRGSR